MEEVYPRPGETPPAVVTRTHPGGGRSVYIAFDIGEVFWRALQSDHGRLIAGAATWALGEQAPRVQVTGNGLVDLAVRVGSDEIAVTVVNLATPMAMRGQRHDALPLHDQEVILRVLDGAQFDSAELVIAESSARAEVRGQQLHIPIDRMDDLEVVQATWTPIRTHATHHGGKA